METDPVRRRAILLALAVLFSIGIGGAAVAVGGFGSITTWYQDAKAGVAQLPVNDPDHMYANALEFEHEGNSTFAIAAARRAVIVSPDYLPARRFLAAKALKNNDFDEAAEQCRRMIHANPNDGAAQLGLANAYQGLGQSKKAEGIYQDVLDNSAFDSVVRQTAKESLGGLQGKASSH